MIANVPLSELPKDITLDGELFGGRGEFQSTVSIVKTINSPHWKGITFQVRLPFLILSLSLSLDYGRFLIYPHVAMNLSKTA
jgi:hypothetical protein